MIFTRLSVRTFTFSDQMSALLIGNLALQHPRRLHVADGVNSNLGKSNSATDPFYTLPMKGVTRNSYAANLDFNE
jgi:hypothetical protein